MKNIRIFVSENFQFLEVKVSIYLIRRVFVMGIRFSLRDKWLFEVIDVVVTRVDCTLSVEMFTCTMLRVNLPEVAIYSLPPSYP